jgi:bla regulator protein blaR1
VQTSITSFRRRRGLFLSALGLVIVAAPVMRGRAQSTPIPAQPQASSLPSPTFEVASIKPTNPQTRSIGMFTYPGGKLIITKYTLKMLIHEAYGVNDNQISGGANWTSEELYDVEAIPLASSESSKFSPATPKTPPTAEMLMMLRNLLADRFQLKLHSESKLGSGFALVVGAHGAKLNETKNPDAFKVVSSGHTGKAELPDFIHAENASMSMFAAWLARAYRCPVLDETGIKGDFDFRFEYASGDSESDSGPALFTVIQDQLGLKLVSRKAPIEILVIDHVEKPSGN